jgi:hypothetical protein
MASHDQPAAESGPAQTSRSTAAAITGLVPMIQVQEMDRSIAFYRLLGFEVGNYVPREGPVHWAWLYSPAAGDWKRGPNLMLTRSECAVDADAQEVLFYLYATDLPVTRAMLLEHGFRVSEITYPEYLPEGECRASDPDGYTLMIAQATMNTP